MRVTRSLPATAPTRTLTGAQGLSRPYSHGLLGAVRRRLRASGPRRCLPLTSLRGLVRHLSRARVSHEGWGDAGAARETACEPPATATRRPQTPHVNRPTVYGVRYKSPEGGVPASDALGDQIEPHIRILTRCRLRVQTDPPRVFREFRPATGHSLRRPSGRRRPPATRGRLRVQTDTTLRDAVRRPLSASVRGRPRPPAHYWPVSRHHPRSTRGPQRPGHDPHTLLGSPHTQGQDDRSATLHTQSSEGSDGHGGGRTETRDSGRGDPGHHPDPRSHQNTNLCGVSGGPESRSHQNTNPRGVSGPYSSEGSDGDGCRACGSRRLVRLHDTRYCVDCFRQRRYDRLRVQRGDAP
jgi:hypothetical protein